MLRSLTTLVLLAAGTAGAAIWPEQLAGYKRTSAKPVELQDQAVWVEYGVDLTEQATYVSGQKGFTGTAWRLRDPTGALAAFQWLRPADARPSDVVDLAVEIRGGLLMAWQNYLFRFDGWQPAKDDILLLLGTVPRLDMSALPTLPQYLPGSVVANSERYILGPASLGKFEPRISPSLAGFHYGTEGELAKVATKAGTMDLALFSYPTPQIARQKLAEFQQLPGAMAKFTGPLVAVLLAPGNADEAERVLASIRYEAHITQSERIPTRRDNVADLLLNIFMLTGLLMLLMVAGGIAVALMRRSFRWSRDEEPMILLHLEDRR